MFDFQKDINYFSFYNIEIDKDDEYLLKLNECVDNIKRAYTDENLSFPKDKVNLICEEIDKTYKTIRKIFNDSLSGRYDKAIQKTKELVAKYEEILIRPLNKTWAFNKNYLKENIYFYKGRISEVPYGNYSYKDMHIIPSNKRELISTQRYSIPGVPCLYLASNSFVVWNELGRPRFDNLCISCFKIKEPSIKVLDLSYGYRNIFEEIATNYLGDQEVFYIEDKNGKFKSEYLISQLLMHCLGKCKGVLYRSSAMDGKYGLPAINLAIPNLVCNLKKLYGHIGDYVNVTDSFNLQYYVDNCSDVIYRYRTEEHNPFEITNYKPKSTFNKMLEQIAGSNTYDLNFPYKGSIYYFFDDYLIERNNFKNIDSK